ncbi:uncharacterized protein F5147DRAFT_666122, partial [Suillus discolor]
MKWACNFLMRIDQLCKSLVICASVSTAILHRCESKNTTHCAQKEDLYTAVQAVALFGRGAPRATFIGASLITGNGGGI